MYIELNSKSIIIGIVEKSLIFCFYNIEKIVDIINQYRQKQSKRNFKSITMITFRVKHYYTANNVMRHK